MDSATDGDTEYEPFLKKFFIFKQNHLNLQQVYRKVVDENKVLKHEIQVLESRLKLEEHNQFSLDVIKQQEVILECFRKNDDYIDIKNLCNSLQEEVQSLKTQLETARTFYEKEMKNILETTSQKVIEIREIKQAELNEKKRQMETNYEDLHHKNEALKTILETVSAESENKITRLNIKYEHDMAQMKESKTRLESENRMLIEKLLEQEKFFKARIKLFGIQNKESLRFIEQENKKRNFSLLQTLDEAFLSDNQCHINPNSPEASYFPSEDKLLTPYVTDESLAD